MDLQPSQIPEPELQEKQKNKYWKFIWGFLALILGVYFLFVVLFYAVKTYEQKQSEIQVQQLKEQLDKWQRDNLDRAMADTYGGKTPQETLRMYIDAVQKGDYELASKYFIEDYRDKELRSFNGATEEKIDNYLNLLRKALLDKGGYSFDKKEFSVEKPIGVRMELYPNGIWKIVEI